MTRSGGRRDVVNGVERHGEPGVFDCDALSKRTLAALQQHAEKIRVMQDHVRRIAAESVLNIGKELHAAQTKLAHRGNGTFIKWCTTCCGLTPRSAYRSIAAYRTFKDYANLSRAFDASSLYLLSAEETPKEALQTVLQVAQNGQRITHQRVRQIVQELQCASSANGPEKRIPAPRSCDTTEPHAANCLPRDPSEAESDAARLLFELTENLAEARDHLKLLDELLLPVYRREEKKLHSAEREHIRRLVSEVKRAVANAVANSSPSALVVAADLADSAVRVKR